ncbi:MAG: MFS transporter [Deltaproteobacteria bacterium]|nr:MFS transporter [Deltaproteobacteria bacterium]
MSEKPKKVGFFGIKNIAFQFLIMASGGFGLYSQAIIFPAMIKAEGWARGSASVALTLMVLIMGALAPVVAISINRYGNKKTLMFGLIVITVSTILLGTIVTKIWMWTLLWGIIGPIGFAFGNYIPIIANIMLWFNIRRALMIGIAMTGLAVGGFVAQPLCTWLIVITGSWQTGWFAAAVAGFIAFILSFFIVEKPEDIGQFQDGLNPAEIESEEDSKTRTPKTYRSLTNWPLKEVLKTPAVWLLIFICIAYMQALMLIITHGVLHFTDIGFTPMQAASVLSFIILCSAISGPPMGALGDRIEPRWVVSFAMITLLLMLLGLWKAPSFGFLMAVGPVFGFCYGTLPVMTIAITGNYFGPESFAKVNGIIGPFGTVGSATIPVVAGAVVDKTGSYDIVFIIVGFVLLGGFICALLLKPPVPRFNEQYTQKTRASEA